MKIDNKFLLKQYANDRNLKIKHNYLTNQFKDYKIIFKEIEKLILSNEFTLGSPVGIFEKKIKTLLKSKYVISVGSGTDALMLSLKCLGVKDGDEVITTPYTFYATIGAIVTAGAKPIFVDTKEDYNINADEIEKKITKKTKAIMPVHWSGRICDMDKIKKISKKYKLPIVEDACHAILATRKKKLAGNFGDMGCFSLHPLKNLNVWGDGGFILTNNKDYYNKLMLLRNHGLISRNINKIFGYNSRLDSIQAIVGIHLLKKIKNITKNRIKNSHYLDKKLSKNQNLVLKERKGFLREVFHLYEFRVKNCLLRDKLVDFLRGSKIDAKIHYPVPMHLQPASKFYGYKNGDFPVTENIAKSTISLPVHEFISRKQLDKMIKKIEEFYNEN
jgi:dTDP-4-amino-4,6-dideoxygalactose transaminase